MPRTLGFEFVVAVLLAMLSLGLGMAAVRWSDNRLVRSCCGVGAFVSGFIVLFLAVFLILSVAHTNLHLHRAEKVELSVACVLLVLLLTWNPMKRALRESEAVSSLLGRVIHFDRLESNQATSAAYSSEQTSRAIKALVAKRQYTRYNVLFEIANSGELNDVRKVSFVAIYQNQKNNVECAPGEEFTDLWSMPPEWELGKAPYITLPQLKSRMLSNNDRQLVYTHILVPIRTDALEPVSLEISLRDGGGKWIKLVKDDG